MRTKTPITISDTTHLLLESLRLMETARSLFYDWVLAAISDESQIADRWMEQYADPAWNHVREMMNEQLKQTVYEWAATDSNAL